MSDLSMQNPSEDDICMAFAIMDADGDDVLDAKELTEHLKEMGKNPTREDVDKIIGQHEGKGCDGTRGMDLYGFYKFVNDQLVDQPDEARLREAFEIFDCSPPDEGIYASLLRRYLTNMGDALTHAEVDFLFTEHGGCIDGQRLIEKLLNT